MDISGKKNFLKPSCLTKYFLVKNFLNNLGQAADRDEK
jgi:hypothetical protein